MKLSLTILVAAALFGSSACHDSNSSSTTSEVQFSKQAYIVSEQSNELFVVDFSEAIPVAVGSVDTTLHAAEVNDNHMAIVGEDGTKIYVVATHQNALIVVDRASMSVTKTIPVGAHPSHGTVRQGYNEIWLVNEDDNSISVVDTLTDEVVKTLTDTSIVVPHMVRWDANFTTAYVPSIGGNQITIFDATTYLPTGTVIADGLAQGPCSADPCGFADCQIDPNGFLYAAHIESGKVLVYDTITRTRVGDFTVGNQPWSAFVDLFGGQSLSHYLVPNFGDATLSRVDNGTYTVTDTLAQGDSEVYGVNYSPLAPNQAFVMQRNQNQVVVLDTITGALIDAIDVGGTVETACTTNDGRFIIAPISSTGQVVMIDPATRTIVATFDNVGTYPWSAATLGGQNYCH